MRRNKGFTLIELLAVIVVLAVIALIATPVVLKLVDQARKGAAESSAYSYIKAVENGIMEKLIETPSATVKGTFTINKKNKIVNESGIEINIDLKGKIPDLGGIIIIGESGNVTSATLNINNYEVECLNDKCNVKGKVEEVTYPTILEKATSLVYDENGTCKTDGSTYKYMDGCYIKGASDDNYVWYNGFMWRIMGINSDGTVRLITDENVTALAYGVPGTGFIYEKSGGYIHDWLNEYFYNNLNSTKNIIQEGAYFCSETTNGVVPTEGRTICSKESEVTTKVGTISVDEYLLSYDESSYLIIDQYYWTMTPFDVNGAHRIASNGAAGANNMYYGRGIRPVINVSSDAFVTEGNGSSNTFYVLGEDKTNSVKGKLSEKVTSGEYVSLEGHTYRVVSKDNNGVKLILDGFYEEIEGTIYTMSYGDNNTFALDSGIGQKLNGDVLKWLRLTDSKKIIEAMYYQGSVFGKTASYITSLEKSNEIKAKVGLIQIGDIMASQSSTLLTENYTLASSQSNTSTYWTMSKYENNDLSWLVNRDGTTTDNNNGVSYKTNGIRPVITVKNDLDITSGTGTWKNPYKI